MGSLTLSASGLSTLSVREGVVDGFYNDSQGLCTYGIGHLVHSADKKWGCFLLQAAKSNDTWDKKVLFDPVTQTNYLPRSAVGWTDWSDLRGKAIELGTGQIAQNKYGKETSKLTEGEKAGAKTIAEQAVGVETSIIANVPLQLFKQKIKGYESSVNKTITITLVQDEFDALVSFAYNVGTDGFESSTVARKINENEYRAGDKIVDREKAIKEIEDAFLKWNKPPEIIGRRKEEAASFLKPARDEVTALRLKTPPVKKP
jgi:GH24 family phage-related lysozyme (muramidase)